MDNNDVMSRRKIREHLPTIPLTKQYTVHTILYTSLQSFPGKFLNSSFGFFPLPLRLQYLQPLTHLPWPLSTHLLLSQKSTSYNHLPLLLHTLLFHPLLPHPLLPYPLLSHPLLALPLLPIPFYPSTLPPSTPTPSTLPLLLPSPFSPTPMYPSPFYPTPF